MTAVIGFSATWVMLITIHSFQETEYDCFAKESFISPILQVVRYHVLFYKTSFNTQYPSNVDCNKGDTTAVISDEKKLIFLRVLILRSLLGDFTFMKDLKNKAHPFFVM